jgi:hypothetical protein
MYDIITNTSFNGNVMQRNKQQISENGYHMYDIITNTSFNGNVMQENSRLHYLEQPGGLGITTKPRFSK